MPGIVSANKGFLFWLAGISFGVFPRDFCFFWVCLALCAISGASYHVCSRFNFRWFCEYLVSIIFPFSHQYFVGGIACVGCDIAQSSYAAGSELFTRSFPLPKPFHLFLQVNFWTFRILERGHHSLHLV